MQQARIVIQGAAGRVGQRLLALGAADPAIEVLGILRRPGQGSVGGGVAADEGETAVPVFDRLPHGAGVLIDFSRPEGAVRAAERCADAGVALVSGTTGLDPEQLAAVHRAGRSVPVLHAANMSTGVTVLLAVAERVAQAWGEGFDPEIVEAHHRHKQDAPSGTALALAEAICRGRGWAPGEAIRDGRGPGPRGGAELPIHALRMGDVVGRHEAVFAGPGEEISLTHTATDRDVFARGALRAAKWIVGRPPGRYRMADVLGL